MLVENYLKKQLENVPEPLKGAFKDIHSIKRLAEIQQVICTSVSLFQTGKPMLTQYFAVQNQTFATKQEILLVAGSLAVTSRSPLLQAIALASREAGLMLREMEIDTHSGGLTGKLDRTWYLLGDAAYMEAEGVDLGVTSLTLAQQLEAAGKEIIFLAQRQPKRLLGIFGCDTPLHSEAVAMVQKVKDLQVGWTLLTEQKTSIAKGVAHQLGISLVHSEVPTDEQAAVLDALLHSQPDSAVLTTPGYHVTIPHSAFTIIAGKRASERSDLLLPDIALLPECVSLARSLLVKTKRRYFWCTLEKI